MHVSRGVFDVETVVRKLSSRFRRPRQVSRPKWPVISAIQPLFYLIRLFGLAPFEISEDQFIPGSYDVIYSLFCTLVQTYAVYTVLNRPATQRQAVLLNVTETGKVIFNYCVVMLNVLMTLWSRKEFIRVLNIVKNFDSKIRDLGYQRKEGATKVWAWSTCVCSVIVWIIVSRSGMIAFNEYWIDNMAFLFNYLTGSLSIIKFSSIVLLLGQRFRFLNRVAQRSKESTTTKFSLIDFKVIHQLHNDLMNAGESLSSQYSWALLLWLANLCIHSVSTLHSLLTWLIENADWETTRWFRVICESWWLFTYVVQVLLLHITCDFTSTEANIMGAIMVNWMPSNISRNYRKESFLHFINRRLDFTAAGCFHVNLPLLRSITAILTTYLVLMLQS